MPPRKKATRRVKSTKPSGTAAIPVNAPESPTAHVDDANPKKAPTISPPSPRELLAFAQAIHGFQPLPAGNQARENLLRDALALWQRASHLIADLERFGYQAVTTKDMSDRCGLEAGVIGAEHRAQFPKWEYTFDEMIRAVCAEEAPDRALKKFREWLLANCPIGDTHPVAPENRVTDANLSRTMQQLRAATFSAIDVQNYGNSFREWWPKSKSAKAAAAVAKRNQKL